MNALVLVILLAAPSYSAPSTATAENDAALAQAAFAAGRPLDEVIADYAQAAKLDPRYDETYQGLIVQRDSERIPGYASMAPQMRFGDTIDDVALILGITAAGFIAVVAALALVLGGVRGPP